jgi:MFS transporter, FHS family, L-fucose permease
MMERKILPKKNILLFVLITSLFALWGFANDITNTMVAAFRTVMSNAKAALIQLAFYGGFYDGVASSIVYKEVLL